jgi:hypothetical protein
MMDYIIPQTKHSINKIPNFSNFSFNIIFSLHMTTILQLPKQK